MIYDCFQFFNELDILKLRLEIMDPIVDYFVISEATTTFSGLEKPLYYLENQEMFSKFKDKIIHVTVEDTPPGGTHERDTFQKNAVGRGLASCNPEDIIIFSDLDEIPNPDKIREILENFQKDKIYHFAQRLFYCYLNMEEMSGNLLSYAGEFEGIERKKWIGTKMCTYGLMQENHIQTGELRFPQWKEIGIRVEDGGWHFGYMGGHGEKDIAKRIAEKVRSAAHDEYNNRNILSQAKARIQDGADPFGREARFERVEIDEGFPEYLRTHQEDYEYLICPEETEDEKNKRHEKLKKAELRQEQVLFLKRTVKRWLGLYRKED